MKYVTAAVVAFTFLAIEAKAVTLDESIDGDAGALGASRDVGTLATGANTFVGSVDGGSSFDASGPDELDSIRFTSSGGFTADASASGVRLVLALFDDSSSIVQSANITNGSETDIFGGTIPAGIYQLNLVPTGNSGQASYTLTLNENAGAVVPLPLPAMTLLSGLGLFWAVRRRT
ncbi:MAG: hypothetical protein ACFBWO_00910 [Paracoccaceae bacterium]